MTIRKWLSSLTLLALFQPLVASAAIDARVPIVLLINKNDFNSRALVQGIYVESLADKTADVQIRAFEARTRAVNWTELARHELACFAVEDAQPCRQVSLLEPNTKLDELIKRTASTKVIVMELVQMFRPSSRYRARLIVREIDLDEGKRKEARSFTALYESYVPREFQEGLYESTPGAGQYWSAGTPNRLENEARHSLVELRRLAETLEAAVVAKDQIPADWKKLPKLKALKQAGRVRCGGLQCLAVRVYDERDGRIWFASTELLRAYGPTLASLDANAAAHETNLFLLVVVPI